jgi:hypothetical protein
VTGDNAKVPLADEAAHHRSDRDATGDRATTPLLRRRLCRFVGSGA